MEMNDKYRLVLREDSIFGEGNRQAAGYDTIQMIAVVSVILFGCLMLVILPALAKGSGLAGAVVFTVILCVSVCTFLVFRSRRNNKVFMEKLLDIPDDEFEELCKEARTTKIFCKTFFLLSNIIYIPKMRMMIPYKNIYRVFAVFNSSSLDIEGAYPRRAQLRIWLKNEKIIKVPVSDPIGFRAIYGSFLEKMSEKGIKINGGNN